MDDTKQLFIKEILEEHGQFLHGLFVDSLKEKSIEDTGTLMNSISYKIKRRGNNFVLNFTFPGYGRALEIKYYKSKNSQKIPTINTNRLLWNIRSKNDMDSAKIQRKKNNAKRDLRWYSKNLYGSQNRLIGHLGSGYIEDEIKRLKGLLEEAKANGTYSQILMK